MKHKYTNNLIHSTSPYLLQHAHNPVNWQPWSDDIIALAKKENKLILVSIGYAACHWCHVMEHESFENEEVAAVMNKNFICVKVDREERPDVDHYYMTAVQLMQQQGGWPLNVIALPDGKPIWGGTYFPKDTWIKTISSIAKYYSENQETTVEYGENLQKGIEQVSLTAQLDVVIPATSQLMERGVFQWKSKFDMENGGRLGQPKFPMPVNLDFLMYYGFIKDDQKCLDFVEITLEKMARGGIYDQIGGGFARYSVDEIWKVPHFEKMLYDNGQLLSIYSKGFQRFQNHEFKTVVYETADFIERELTDKSGAFYSSLDADSEGEEGKFYVWSKKDLEKVLEDDFEFFSNYYNVNSKGLWESGNYILLRNESDENFAAKYNLEADELQQKISLWKNIILKERSKRIRPGLDDKTLTSWNALVIQGLVDAYKTFSEKKFLELALKNAHFIQSELMLSEGKLFHTWKNGKSSVDGFLEDYALVIHAFISLFEVTGDKSWFDISIHLNEFVIQHFYDQNSGLFYFSEKNRNNLLTNHFQKEDNVIPASNSVMANNLHKLYLIEGKPEYLIFVKRMLHHVTSQFATYPMAYANWGNVMLKLNESYFEVAVSGKESAKTIKELQTEFHPNILWAFSENESEVPLLKDRFVKGKTLIYICREGVCQLPVETAEDALKILKK